LSVPEHIERINLIIVQPHGRSGSLFLQSLFDGHPQVTTLPHFGPIFREIAARIDDPAAELDAFILRGPHLFDSAQGYFGDGTRSVAGAFGSTFSDTLRVDPAAFRSAALRIFRGAGPHPFSRATFFRVVHLAYAECVRGVAPDLKFILYHPHNYAERHELLAAFPHLRFIAMTRDPRQDWDSWRRVLALRARTSPDRLSPMFMLNTAAAYADLLGHLCQTARELGPDALRVIDLPTLHRLGSTAMHRLCEWLDISYDECLTRSTFNGLPWAGNAADRSVRTGFQPDKVTDRWRDELPSDQAAVLSTLLSGAIEWLRYEPGARIDVAAYFRARSGFGPAALHIAQKQWMDGRDLMMARPGDRMKTRLGRPFVAALALARDVRAEVTRYRRGDYAALPASITASQIGMICIQCAPPSTI
jgi:hypothetical protein